MAQPEESLPSQGANVRRTQPVGFGTIKGKKWKVTLGGAYTAGVPLGSGLTSVCECILVDITLERERDIKALKISHVTLTGIAKMRSYIYIHIYSLTHVFSTYVYIYIYIYIYHTQLTFLFYLLSHLTSTVITNRTRLLCIDFRLTAQNHTILQSIHPPQMIPRIY